MLLVFALLAALAALMNFTRAPAWSRTLWLVAVATTEFGHLLVLLPLGVAVLAWVSLGGGLRVAVVGLCAFGAAGLLRPAVGAWRIGRMLPHRLGAVGGNLPAGVPWRPFSWRRLWWHPVGVARRPVRREVVARHGGVELALDFYGPSGCGPAPCLVVIHGGGWDSGDLTQLAAWNHRWASRGWAVAALSYRLAPRWVWPAQREDVLDAVAWLTAHAAELGIAAQQLVLVGRSAGGQIATAVGYGPEAPRFKGVIAFYAPHDMPFSWSVSREDDALNSVRLMRQFLGGPPDSPEQQARYHSASGQLLARPGVPPTLLLHGPPDTLAWHRHSERLAARLAELGVPHHYLRLPWATHGFDYNPDGPGGQLADYATEFFLRALTTRPHRG